MSLPVTLFIIIILFSGSIAPSLLIQESDAMVAQGTPVSVVGSDKVCGDQLCSVINATPTSPEGQIVIPEDEKQEYNPDASLLFVQTAGSGTFEDKDGKKILTFVDVSPTTVYFSDRPDRITGFTQTDVFVAVWGEGEDSFADDPPNAALELLDWDGQSDVYIIELLSATYNPETEILQYEVKILEAATEGLSHYNKYNDLEIPATFENSVLFIDNAVGDWFEDKYDKAKDGLETGGDYVKKYTIDPITGEVTTLITPYVSESVTLLCDIGSKIDGKVGCAIGSELAMETVGTFLGAVTMQDIGTALDPDLVPLATAIEAALTSPSSEPAVALAVSYNLFDEQRANIKNHFLTFMHGFRDNPAMTTAYDADNFCGMANDHYFENVLYPFFLYNLQHELYFTILDDLNNGMTLSEVQSDLDENLDVKIDAVIIYSLVHIGGTCLDMDLQSLDSNWSTPNIAFEYSGLYGLIYDSIDHAYKVNLVASSNSDGDTTIPSVFPSALDLAAAEATQTAVDLVTATSSLGLPSASEKAAVKTAVKTAAKAQVYADLEAQLVPQRASFGVDESSLVSEVSVSSDPIIDAGLDTVTSDIESSMSSEASSQIESFTENPDKYMEDFETDLINFEGEEDVMLEDIVVETIEDTVKSEVGDALEDAVKSATGEAIEDAVKSDAAEAAGV